MKAAELVKFSESTMKALSNVGIRISDYRHLALWTDYCAMVADGHKKTFALAVVANRYKVSERTAIRIINRFNAVI